MNTLLNEIFQGETDQEFEFEFEDTSVPAKVKMKNANDMVNVWNVNLKSTPQKVDINSKEFRENYIDNFVKYQVMTPDSTNQNYYFRIYFANGKERKFNVNEVPIVYNPPKVTGYRTVRINIKPDGYLRDKDGLLFPVSNGKIHYSTAPRFTPKLAALRLLVEWRKNALKVMEVGAMFAKIVSAVSGLGDIKTK